MAVSAPVRVTAAPLSAFVQLVGADLGRKTFDGARASPRWSCLRSRADVVTLLQAATWLRPMCADAQSLLMWMGLLLLVSRREVVTTAVRVIQERAVSREGAACTPESASMLVSELQGRFLECETRWDTRRPSGGLKRLARLVEAGWDDLAQFARKLAAKEPAAWSVSVINAAIPGKMAAYVLSSHAESYHRAQLVRFVSLLPLVLGAQPSVYTESDWESYTSLFPGTKTGANELGLRSYSDAVAAVRRINASVEDLAVGLADSFTLADLSCALCMRGSRQYHKDEGRPFAVRERREGSPPAASRQPPIARSIKKPEKAVGQTRQKRPLRGPPEVHGAAAAQPRVLQLLLGLGPSGGAGRTILKPPEGRPD